jgi:hypothetical protein
MMNLNDWLERREEEGKQDRFLSYNRENDSMRFALHLE